MKDEMLERMARAICEAEGYTYIQSEHYDKMAQAAADAMFDYLNERAGDDAVVEAAQREMPDARMFTAGFKAALQAMRRDDHAG